MARLNVNPTRMELRTLKNRLKTSIRGHKLLKDKSDETIRRFLVLIKENKSIRDEVEKEVTECLRSFLLVSAINGRNVVEEAVLMPSSETQIVSKTNNIMGVNVPSIEIKESESVDYYPYSFASVSADLDTAIIKMSNLLVKLIKLAEIEKSCDMLADEIEKNRRRVNALEYIVVPNLKETIRYIKMKLDENERANTIRLMKVKEIIKDK